VHVCLICIELFGDSIHGGFGRSTRFIGRELVRRGIAVTIVVPRRSDDYPDTYDLEGMTVRQYLPHRPWAALSIFRSCHADVFHSQDASVGTFLARVAAPGSRHIVTLRDPMDDRDWQIETDYSELPRAGWLQYRYFIDNPLVATAVKRAHSLYCAAEFLIPKVMRKYHLTFRPGFLPTPVDVPAAVVKAERPTVCFIGRWEGRKRPELFFKLALEFPAVRFIAVGGARDTEQDRRFRELYGGIPSLEMTGVLDQFRTGELSAILGKSWIIVNTSLREGLPVTFVEGAAHRCAILAFNDPDGFASRFGCLAQEGRLREALQFLLAENRWKERGEAGYRYVNQIFSTDKAMEAHLAAYRAVLGAGAFGLS